MAVTHAERLAELFAAWRSGDALRAAAYFAVDGSYREAGRDAIVGRDALVAYFTRFFRDGPRFTFDHEPPIVDGDAAAVAYRFGTAGLDGTWLERGGCAIVTFANGTIVAWREYAA